MRSGWPGPGRAVLVRHVGGEVGKQASQGVQVGAGEAIAEPAVEGGRRIPEPEKGRLAGRSQFHHVDARHALDAAAWRDSGWDYRAPGRPGDPAGLPGALGDSAGAPGALAGHPAGVPRHAAGPREAEEPCLAAAI